MSRSSIQNNPLIGIWKLVSAIAIQSDGTIDSEVYGTHPVGYITYTLDGHMMVMFAKSDRTFLSQDIRSPFSKDIYDLPIEEYAQAFLTFNAYAGTYEINGDHVMHHVAIASIPNRVGTKLVRTFTVQGDQLTLTTPQTLSDGVPKVFQLMWERG
ncbi:MAG: lipocalin-like domain-containing protein [Waterburya sp.]